MLSFETFQQNLTGLMREMPGKFIWAVDATFEFHSDRTIKSGTFSPYGIPTSMILPEQAKGTFIADPAQRFFADYTRTVEDHNDVEHPPLTQSIPLHNDYFSLENEVISCYEFIIYLAIRSLHPQLCLTQYHAFRNEIILPVMRTHRRINISATIRATVDSNALKQTTLQPGDLILVYFCDFIEKCNNCIHMAFCYGYDETTNKLLICDLWDYKNKRKIDGSCGALIHEADDLLSILSTLTESRCTFSLQTLPLNTLYNRMIQNPELIKYYQSASAAEISAQTDEEEPPSSTTHYPNSMTIFSRPAEDSPQLGRVISSGLT